MSASKPPRVSTPHEIRRASCADCPWESRLMSAGHTARDHVRDNPSHSVVMVKTITQTFAGSEALMVTVGRPAALPDVPAF